MYTGIWVDYFCIVFLGTVPRGLFDLLFHTLEGCILHLSYKSTSQQATMATSTSTAKVRPEPPPLADEKGGTSFYVSSALEKVGQSMTAVTDKFKYKFSANDVTGKFKLWKLMWQKPGLLIVRPKDYFSASNELISIAL